MPPKGSRMVKEDQDSRSEGSSSNLKQQNANAGATRGKRAVATTNGNNTSHLRDTLNANDSSSNQAASSGSNAVCPTCHGAFLHLALLSLPFSMMLCSWSMLMIMPHSSRGLRNRSPYFSHTEAHTTWPLRRLLAINATNISSPTQASVANHRPCAERNKRGRLGKSNWRWQ